MYNYPHFISLLVIVVAITAHTKIDVARQRGELEEKGPLWPLIFFLPWMVIRATLLYLFGAFLIIWLIKCKWLGLQPYMQPVLPEYLRSEFAEPMTRIAVLICYSDNFADRRSLEKGGSFGFYLLGFIMLFLPVYYGIMGISWLLARIISVVGGFDPIYVKAADKLFSIPKIHPDTTINTLAIVFLILIAALISYKIREFRTLGMD